MFFDNFLLSRRIQASHTLFKTLLILTMIIAACSSDLNSNNEELMNNQKADSLNLELSIIPFKSTKLNPKADTITRKWPMYDALTSEVSRMTNYTVKDVIINISTIEKVIDSLQRTIPKAIDTFPVLSRIKVLNTKAKYLLMESEKQIPNLKEVKVIAEELPLEFNALKTQMNEVFIELPEFE